MKNSRRRAREFALQALYQWLVNECGADVLLAQFKEQKDFAKADQALVETLLRGVTADADALRNRFYAVPGPARQGTVAGRARLVAVGRL